jgi:hypothetical protein
LDLGDPFLMRGFRVRGIDFSLLEGFNTDCTVSVLIFGLAWLGMMTQV